jgi:hypothetical protein
MGSVVFGFRAAAAGVVSAAMHGDNASNVAVMRRSDVFMVGFLMLFFQNNNSNWDSNEHLQAEIRWIFGYR